MICVVEDMVAPLNKPPTPDQSAPAAFRLCTAATATSVQHPNPIAAMHRSTDYSAFDKCADSNLFISNIVASFLPNTVCSFLSATMLRPSVGLCSLCALMYSQTLLTTSPRGNGPVPTISANSFDGV